ncbi:RDD family protein [Salinicoccus cyprini]|uniref:RDD family protein n=1 Tax=Salinicoccus cyprini TaxID=2493691 RepID=A0A558AXG9_9STAP|nr:RDD family protein [Salinicoccus cyprini]TVT28950.1 RDD family protein [Salinicoccus cyprini]
MSNVAGFWVRLGARVLDALLIGMVIGTLVFVFRMDTESRLTQAIESVASILYFVLFPTFVYGYTVAKRLLNIRIVKKDGTDVNLSTMVLREVLGGIIYAVTFGLALIVSAFMVGLRKDKRAIHDLIAGTYVTHDRAEHWE